MNRGGDLIDVLPTRTLCANRMQFDLGIWDDGNVVGYFQHQLQRTCFGL